MRKIRCINNIQRICLSQKNRREVLISEPGRVRKDTSDAPAARGIEQGSKMARAQVRYLPAETDAGEAAAERLSQVHCQLAWREAAAFIENCDGRAIAINGNRQFALFREKFGAIRLPAGNAGIYDRPPGMKRERKLHGRRRIPRLDQVEFGSGKKADQVIRRQPFFCDHGIDVLDLPFTFLG